MLHAENISNAGPLSMDTRSLNSYQNEYRWYYTYADIMGLRLLENYYCHK